MVRNSCEIKIRYALLLCPMCMVKRFIFVRNKKRFIWWKLLYFASIRNYTFGRFDLLLLTWKLMDQPFENWQKMTKSSWVKVKSAPILHPRNTKQVSQTSVILLRTAAMVSRTIYSPTELLRVCWCCRVYAYVVRKKAIKHTPRFTCFQVKYLQVFIKLKK